MSGNSDRTAEKNDRAEGKANKKNGPQHAMQDALPDANEPGQPLPIAFVPGLSHNLPTPRVALAIGAHPDDVEFGAGGTLAKWASAGCEIHYVVCTDGSKGTWDPNADTAALVVRREQEQIEAARRLTDSRVGTLEFLGYVDGELPHDLEARRLVAEVIRRVRPDVVLGHDPWKQYRLHPDHRAAGFITCDAIVSARDPHFYPDLDLAPHRPDHLLLWEADIVDHVEDVTDFVDHKIAALEAFESQFESTMHAVDESQLRSFERRIHNRLATIGKESDVGMGEAFKRISNL